MTKNIQPTSIDGVNLDSSNIQYISGKKVLPLEGRIKKRISKLNLSNDYDRRVQKDEVWLQTEDEVVAPRRKKIEKHVPTHEMELAFEEVANNILCEPILSHSYGNPEWYPPVPEHTPPIGRKVSAQDIREKRFQIAQENMSIRTPQNQQGINITVSENFGDAWVHLVEELVEVLDLEKLNKTFQKGETKTIGLNIPPLINPDNFLVQIQNIEQSYGIIESKGKYSYPNLVVKVSWAVYCCCTKEGTQLIGVVCHRNTIAIEEVTAFLADAGISNIDDCNEAILSLSEAHWKLNNSSK